MQIRTADLEHSTGKCRARPSISGCLRRTFLHFQFGPDGNSRLRYAVAILGHFDPLRLHWTREKRDRKRGDTLLRHSITNPFKNARRIGSPSCSLTKRHRPRWSTTVGLLSLRLPKPRNRGLESERVSPFPTTWPLRSFSTSPGQNFSHQSRSHK